MDEVTVLAELMYHLVVEARAAGFEEGIDRCEGGGSSYGHLTDEELAGKLAREWADEHGVGDLAGLQESQVVEGTRTRKLVVRSRFTAGELQELWNSFFVRSLVREADEPWTFIVEVHGSELWAQCVRPWMQANILPGDEELFSVVLVKYNRRGEEVRRKNVRI